MRGMYELNSLQLSVPVVVTDLVLHPFRMLFIVCDCIMLNAFLGDRLCIDLCVGGSQPV